MTDLAVAIQIDDLIGVITFGQTIGETVDTRLRFINDDTDARVMATYAELRNVWDRLKHHTPPDMVGVPIAMTEPEILAVRAAVRSMIALVQEFPNDAPAQMHVDPTWLITIRGALDAAHEQLVAAQHQREIARLN